MEDGADSAGALASRAEESRQGDVLNVLQFIITVQSDYPGQQGALVQATLLTKYICSAVTIGAISVRTFLSTSSSPSTSVALLQFSGQQSLSLRLRQSVAVVGQL